MGELVNGIDRLVDADSEAGTTSRDQIRIRPRAFRLVSAIAHIRADIGFALTDAVTVVVAYLLAIQLRFIEDAAGVPPGWWQGFLKSLPIIVLVHLAFNVVYGTYGHTWEFASISEAKRLVLASGSAGIVLVAGIMAFRTTVGFGGPLPVSVAIIGSMLTLTVSGTMRFRSRLFSFKRTEAGGEVDRTLVVGVGRTAAAFARLAATDMPKIQVMGFVSVRPIAKKRRIMGVPVVGSLPEIPELVEQYKIKQIVLAGQHNHQRVNDLLDACVATDVRLRILPEIDGVMQGGGAVSDLRDLSLEDLLPRPTVVTDLEDVAEMIRGKRVLITGAGGSIGSEITKQVLALNPAEVIGLDNDETHLFDLNLLLADPKLTLELADIRDESRIAGVFSAHRPHVVFHAAAHKHVPILESCPSEAIKTNIRGTRNVLDAVREYGTGRFVLISTDKAVDPSSVMGSTKRLAEMMVQTEAEANRACSYAAVRFGNVLGSRGSVVPTFTAQIRRGGPVTITHRDMTRYFMVTSEAVHLVLQAASMATNGEIFVLDMGEPVKILDLARRLIRISGAIPEVDVPIVITEPRPGEKLFESLSSGALAESSNPKIRVVADPRPSGDAVEQALKLVERDQDVEPAFLKALLLEVADPSWDVRGLVTAQLEIDVRSDEPVVSRSVKELTA